MYKPQTVTAKQKKLSPRRGQTLVEYGMIIALVSIVAILVLQSLGTHVLSLYSMIDAQVNAAQSGS